VSTRRAIPALSSDQASSPVNFPRFLIPGKFGKFGKFTSRRPRQSAVIWRS
jgi:hypothetical protein